MTLPRTPERGIAVLPLLGNQLTEEAQWLGALIARALIEHLAGAELPVVPYNKTASQLAEDKIQLPPDEAAVDSLKQALKVRAIIHGRFVFDEDAKMLGLSLIVVAPDVPLIPLEASTPLSGFAAFLERVSLAVIERLGASIDDALRQKVSRVPRPTSFEALRQTANATLAWSKGQNQLALTAISSALSLDPDMDEAAAIEVAIARSAGDTTTTRDAFRRWAAIASRRKQPLEAAERLTNLGHWLLAHGEWGEARRAYEDARNLFQAEKNEYGLAEVMNNLANLDMLSGKLQSAIQTYRRSLRVFEGNPDGLIDTVLTYFNLALAHKSLGQPEEAERAIEEALLRARQAKDTPLEARCLAQRGAIRDDLGEWGQADADYTQAARLLDVVGDTSGLAMVKSHQALLKKQQGSYNQAEALMLAALEELEPDSDLHEQAVVWFNLADLYLVMGLYDQSWDYGRRALDVFTRLNSGWKARAKELIATLEQIPPPPPASPADAFGTPGFPDETTSPDIMQSQDEEVDEDATLPDEPAGDDDLYRDEE